MTSDYRPIPCETYAELEVAILQGTRLRVCWFNENGMARLASLLPVDLKTRHSEEFLVARGPHRRQLEIRLDRIQRFVPL